MSKICYQPKKFSDLALATIEQANEIIADYAMQGFDLTLRQLYYQFVSRALIPNKDTEYKKLGSIINDARLAGLVDWSAIVDRTRYVRTNSHWDTPASIIHSAANSFAIDKWASRFQSTRIEVWIEKDALIGVIEPICQELDVSYFSCRGYTSASEMWAAAMRIVGHLRDGQRVVVLHLGDHDPSGIDMSRDIEERLRMFVGHHTGRVGMFTLDRIALTMDQIEEYAPPPNPAKLTDSRCMRYIEEYGDESWELDALDPTTLATLIEDSIVEHRDPSNWDAAIEEEERGRKGLTAASERWGEVAAFLKGEEKNERAGWRGLEWAVAIHSLPPPAPSPGGEPAGRWDGGVAAEPRGKTPAAPRNEGRIRGRGRGCQAPC